MDGWVFLMDVFRLEFELGWRVVALLLGLLLVCLVEMYNMYNV